MTARATAQGPSAFLPCRSATVDRRQLYFSMARLRSLAGQRSLFPERDPAAEVVGSLGSWPDDDLLRLVRAGSYELLRRGRAVPVAAPIAEVMASYPCAEVSV